MKAAGRVGAISRDLCSLAISVDWKSRLGRSICLLIAALSVSLSQASETGNVLDPVNLETLNQANRAGSEPGAPTQPTVQVNPAAVEPELPSSAPEPKVQLNGLRGIISRLEVTPIVQLKTVYDDNLYLRPQKTGDVYYRVSAGLAAGSGDFRDQVSSLGGYQQAYENLQFANFDDRNYFYVAYKPSITIYTDHSELNTLDHDASLGAQGRFGSLILGVRAGVRTFSEGDAEVGDRVRQTLFSADLTARYELSDKTSLEGDFYHITHSYDASTRVNSTEWVNQDFLNYQILPKTNLGAGVTLGYLDVSQGADQTYEQALARVIYDTTHKLKVTLQGGVEYRQVGSNNANSEDSVSPVFSVAVSYSPFDGTNVNLVGQRFVRNSYYYIGENVTSTSVGAVLTQRLFQKLTLSLGASYEHNEYDRSSALVGTSRTDDIVNLQVGLGFHLTRWVGVTAAYTYRHDISTLTSYNFDNNRASLQVDVLF